MAPSDSLQGILSAVAAGELAPAEAQARIERLSGFEAVGDFAKLDWDRASRTGVPEVVWGADKSAEQIARLLERIGQNEGLAIATRLEPSVGAELQARLPQLHYNETANLGIWGSREAIPARAGVVGVITAGTADQPVAEEAAIVAECSGYSVERLWDVGVAGPHRFWHHRSISDRADVLIVVAGMEGALPSVVAGTADAPVIAVPTSIGYGASLGGIAPLLTMLNACTAGIGVVNIDNGLGAAMLAHQILRSGQRLAARQAG